MTNDPYQLKGQPRRRRSERHGNVPAARPPEMKAAYQPDETAPLPLGSETRVVPVAPQPLPPPRQAPVNYDYDRFSGTASNRYVEDEEYDDDDAPRLWPKLLALALGLLLILSVLDLPDGLASLRAATLRGWRDDIAGWWRARRVRASEDRDG